MSDLKLTPVERRALFEALMSAFPTRGALAMLTRLWLDQPLEAITAGGSGQEVVLQLIGWAEAQGRLTDLVTGAQKAVPGNPTLAAFVQTVRAEAGRRVPRPEDGWPALTPQISVRRSVTEQRGRQFALLWVLVSLGLVVAGLLLAKELNASAPEGRAPGLVFLLLVLGFTWWRTTEDLAAQIRWMGPITATAAAEAIGAASPGQGGLLTRLAHLVTGSSATKAAGLALLVVAPTVAVVAPRHALPTPEGPELRDAGVDAARDAAGETADAARMDAHGVAMDARGVPSDVHDAAMDVSDVEVGAPRARARSAYEHRPNGAPCVADVQCESGDCRVDRCASAAGEPCVVSAHCLRGLCIGGRCQRSRGAACTHGLDCLSGLCMGDRCVGWPNEHCLSHDECASGLCMGGSCAPSGAGKPCRTAADCNSRYSCPRGVCTFEERPVP